MFGLCSMSHMMITRLKNLMMEIVSPVPQIYQVSIASRCAYCMPTTIEVFREPGNEVAKTKNEEKSEEIGQNRRAENAQRNS